MRKRRLFQNFKVTTYGKTPDNPSITERRTVMNEKSSLRLGETYAIGETIEMAGYDKYSRHDDFELRGQKNEKKNMF